MNPQIPQGVQEGGARSTVDIQKLAEEINKLRGSLDSVFDKFDGEVTLVFQGKSYTIENRRINSAMDFANIFILMTMVGNEIANLDKLNQTRKLINFVDDLKTSLKRLATRVEDVHADKVIEQSASSTEA